MKKTFLYSCVITGCIFSTLLIGSFVQGDSCNISPTCGRTATCSNQTCSVPSACTTTKTCKKPLVMRDWISRLFGPQKCKGNCCCSPCLCGSACSCGSSCSCSSLNCLGHSNFLVAPRCNALLPGATASPIGIAESNATLPQSIPTEVAPVVAPEIPTPMPLP